MLHACCSPIPVLPAKPRYQDTTLELRTDGTMLPSMTNGGGSMLPTVDGRSLWARIRRDTIGAIIQMLGGADMVSETQSLMARRVGTLEAELIFIEDKFAAIRVAGGEPSPTTLDLYGRLADRQRRLADPLGWHRVPRDIAPTLGDIALEIEAEKQSGT
jgi:hypothetical protein